MSARFFARAALFISLALATVEGTAGFKITREALQKRALSDNTENTIFTPANSTGLFILANINGEDVPVQIDLASGDLYVEGALTGADELGATSTEALAMYSFVNPPVQSAFPIKIGVPVSIGGQKANQDIILNPTLSQGFTQEFPDNDVVGVLGFGPSPLSAVVNGLKTGQSPINQILSQLPSAPFSTILFTGFDEAKPTTLEFSGLFTIGKPINLTDFFPSVPAGAPDLTQITQQPAITLGSENSFPISITVAGASVDKNTAVISTTSLFSSADPSVAVAMYSKLPGSQLDQGSGIYTVPCNGKVNASITIAPMTSPIPLDPATLVIRNPDDPSTCVGSFRTSLLATGQVTLGTSFLPNVYMLLGFNDAGLTQPIMKLLALTDPAEASQYFDATRQGATGPSGSTGTVTSASSSPTAAGAVDLLADDNASNNDSLNLPSGSVADQLRHCLPAIIVGAIVLGLIAIGGAIFALCRRRRSGMRRETAYRNIVHNENMDSSRDLYGHDEESTVKYSDPYRDTN